MSAQYPSNTRVKNRRGDLDALRAKGETVYRWKDVPADLYTVTRAKKEHVALDPSPVAWALGGDNAYRYRLYRAAK